MVRRVMPVRLTASVTVIWCRVCVTRQVLQCEVDVCQALHIFSVVQLPPRPSGVPMLGRMTSAYDSGAVPEIEVHHLESACLS